LICFLAHWALEGIAAGRLKRIYCNGNGCGIGLDVKNALVRDIFEAEWVPAGKYDSMTIEVFQGVVYLQE